MDRLSGLEHREKHLNIFLNRAVTNANVNLLGTKRAKVVMLNQQQNITVGLAKSPSVSEATLATLFLIIGFKLLLTIFLLLQGLKCCLKGPKRLVSDRLMCIFTAAVLDGEPSKSTRNKRLPQLPSYLWVIGVCISLCPFNFSEACSIDSTNGVSQIPCLQYRSSQLMFELTCSFHWSSSDHDCIVLKQHEIFEGNGNDIDITGNNDWEGLFRIDPSVTGLDNAPMIRSVHIIGGKTSIKGGFVIQSGQKHFVVESCSSTGTIQGLGESTYFGGGGICGQKCSGDILIKNCWSTGLIHGHSAGGITGREVGLGGNGNTVNITHCYSTGDIVGLGSGGICGNRAGRDHGRVRITKSFSTGKIKGPVSGGICGESTSDSNGEVIIEQCYSVGEISGRRSGGITGSVTAERSGHTSITNCYSRGNITGSDSAGGICGGRTGRNSGTVSLTNVYSSGVIQQNDAGGLIGEIESDASRISIIMSVYNGETGVMVGGNKDADEDEKTSANLNDIRGTIYCNNVDQPGTKKCWDNQTIWQRVKDDFPVLQDMPTPIPPTPSTSPSPSQTSTSTSTPTWTSSPSQTCTPSPSPSQSQRPKRILVRATQLPVQRPRPTVIDRL